MRTLTQIPVKKVDARLVPRTQVNPSQPSGEQQFHICSVQQAMLNHPWKQLHYTFQVNVKDAGDEATEAGPRLLQDKFSSNLVPFTI